MNKIDRAIKAGSNFAVLVFAFGVPIGVMVYEFLRIAGTFHIIGLLTFVAILAICIVWRHMPDTQKAWNDVSEVDIQHLTSERKHFQGQEQPNLGSIGSIPSPSDVCLDELKKYRKDNTIEHT